MGEKKVAMVCASNQNRSMDAHALLVKSGYKKVWSFGTSNNCKLPGPSIDKPNIYAFGTPYRKIYDDLKRENTKLYTANGLLNMLERNLKVKEAPQRWQETNLKFDYVITFEDRVFETLVEDVINRGSEVNQPLYVFNMDIRDSHQDAAIGAQFSLDLVRSLEVDDWEEKLDEILDKFQQKNKKQVTYTIVFY
eukprot:TRINITY_DN13111_c0_g1_i1.p1 TRINITY_DN13111_c0_g1~~TRINITY_DN13111_c0_g1_i1.p1  ORF type:complete len:193 (+),score=47.27 TRINITY_DN13111_c0_g1_i1:13-591(+)